VSAVPISKTKRRLRALIDRVVTSGRLNSRDIPTIALVPRFNAEVRRGAWHGHEFLEVRLRVPGSTKWGPWLSTERAALVLRDAGFVDHAIAWMTDTFLEEVRRA
jgi:hypothetical protein